MMHTRLSGNILQLALSAEGPRPPIGSDKTLRSAGSARCLEEGSSGLIGDALPAIVEFLDRQCSRRGRWGLERPVPQRRARLAEEALGQHGEAKAVLDEPSNTGISLDSTLTGGRRRRRPRRDLGRTGVGND
jgi:hypothetical protein